VNLVPRMRQLLCAAIIVICPVVWAQTPNNIVVSSSENHSGGTPARLQPVSYVGTLDHGSASVTQRDGGVVSVGGTVVVAGALSDGLILAADSRQTLTFPGGIQPPYKIVSDSANKLFVVGRVGICTYGEAFILGRSIESFVSEYKVKSGKDDDVHDVAKGFTEYFGKYYDQQVAASKGIPSVGFMFAGYDKSGVGRLVEARFPDKRIPFDLQQSTHENQGLAWEGQTDVISRLLKGYDPTIGNLASFQKLPQPDQEEFAKEMGQIEYYIPYNFLSLQDGIDLALSLVQATVDMQRFSFGTMSHPGYIPGVGGTVDVLTITPNETTWVRRKQLAAAVK
jgi:hypothetical protein